MIVAAVDGILCVDLYYQPQCLEVVRSRPFAKI